MHHTAPASQPTPIGVHREVREIKAHRVDGYALTIVASSFKQAEAAAIRIAGGGKVWWSKDLGRNTWEFFVSRHGDSFAVKD